MLALLALLAGADPAFTVNDRTTQTFVVVADRTTARRKADKPAANCGSFACPANGGVGGCKCGAGCACAGFDNSGTGGERSPPVLAAPANIPAGWAFVTSGPGAGSFVPLAGPSVAATPAASPGCYTDPRTGRTVCPNPQRR